VNADTREIQVPANLTLSHFNTLILARDAALSQVKQEDAIIKC